MARPSLLPPSLNGNVFSMIQEVVFLGQRCQFSMYFQRADAGAVTTVLDGYNGIAGYWLNTIIPLLKPCLSVGTLISNIRVWSMRWPDQATGIFNMGDPHGTVAGDPLPPQIAGVLTKQTNLRGRSGRGRMYLCGMSEDSSTNGAPVVAALASMNALCQTLRQQWIDVVTGVTFNPCVVSLKQYAIDSLDPPVPPALIGTPKPPPIAVRGGFITNMVADSIWYTQRRRTLGKGQ